MSHKTPLEAAGEAAAAKGREAFGGMFVLLVGPRIIHWKL